MSTVLRVANALFAAMFAFAAAVQYNDPDPIRWIVIYAAAFAVCLAWDVRPLPRAAPAIVGVAALAWAVLAAFGIHLSAPLGEALTDWSMHAGGSEELRETLGLAIVVLWMAVLTAIPSRRRGSGET